MRVPIRDERGDVIAVMQLPNEAGGQPSAAEDESRFGGLTERLAVILEAWMATRGGAAARA